MNFELKPGERLDDLQTSGLRLIQRPGTFCFGTDSVLLADFAAPRRGEHIADLGCGNGAIALLLAGHRPDARIEAVELQPELADMAARSVALNGLEDRVRVHCADMREAWRAIGRERCSLAVCNPPYGEPGGGAVRPGEAERIARYEDDLPPREIAASAAALLKYGGRFCAVFPARRAFELMAAMQGSGLAPKRVRSVHARADRAPRLMLIEAVKGGASGLNWLPPLILYDAGGAVSDEWKRIYGADAHSSAGE